MKKYKFEKQFSEGVNKWWDSLTLEQKKAFKDHYTEVQKNNATRKFPYPNMRIVDHIKIKDLSNKDIFCIWRFREHKNS